MASLEEELDRVVLNSELLIKSLDDHLGPPSSSSPGQGRSASMEKDIKFIKDYVKDVKANGVKQAQIDKIKGKCHGIANQIPDNISFLMPVYYQKY